MSVLGRIHSFESLWEPWMVPAFVYFIYARLFNALQIFHNRDTWDLDGGREISVEELMKEVVSYRHFMNATGGGVDSIRW